MALLAELGEPLLPEATSVFVLVSTFAGAGITGGGVYDGLVALAARDHGLPLVTRDARAVPTYRALGVAVQVAEV